MFAHLPRRGLVRAAVIGCPHAGRPGGDRDLQRRARSAARRRGRRGGLTDHPDRARRRAGRGPPDAPGRPAFPAGFLDVPGPRSAAGRDGWLSGGVALVRLRLERPEMPARTPGYRLRGGALWLWPGGRHRGLAGGLRQLARRAGAARAAGDAGRLRGYGAGAGDRRGQAAGDPGGGVCAPGGRRAVWPAARVPLAGLFQYLAVAVADQVAGELGGNGHGLLLSVRDWPPAAALTRQARRPGHARGRGRLTPFLPVRALWVQLPTPTSAREAYAGRASERR
jgi:hypothetical protein